MRPAKPLFSTITLVAAFVYWPTAAESAGATRINLTSLSSTVRVAQDGPIQGTPTVEIAGARGETESFQVVVTAEDGRLDNATAQIGPLRAAGGQSLPQECIELFREGYVPVRHSAPRATCAPGLIADPLIPFKNPYTGKPVPEPKWKDEKQIGPRFGADGFEVWAGHHQPLWADVRIPRDATAGQYETTLRVTAGNALAAEILIRLTVWDFALPEVPTHENHFGGFEGLKAYHHLEKDPEKYDRLEERYVGMMSAHRLNPPIPARLWPKPAADGSVLFDNEADRRLTDFVKRYHVSNVPVPGAPFGDVLGAHRAEALRFYRTVFNYLENKGWGKRAYLYMLDEPNDPEAYERVRQLGALVHEAAPGLRRLVVEQPYTENPAWGLLDGAVDIWCPLFGFIDEASVDRVRSRGNTVWSYTALVQPAPPYHPEFAKIKSDNPPYWQIDFPVTSYRLAPWLNRRYHITGLLYWSTIYWGSPDRNPWDDPGFRIRWNGEGALFYPGEDAGIEGPVASIRLKLLRDGMEDYEYFVLLEQAGGKELVDEVVRTAVPTWGAWVQNPHCLPDLRQRLAREILSRRR
jgi:hypothetical protein